MVIGAANRGLSLPGEAIIQQHEMQKSLIVLKIVFSTFMTCGIMNPFTLMLGNEAHKASHKRALKCVWKV